MRACICETCCRRCACAVACLQTAVPAFTPWFRHDVFYAIVSIMGSLHHYNVRLSGRPLPSPVHDRVTDAPQAATMTRCCSSRCCTGTWCSWRRSTRVPWNACCLQWRRLAPSLDRRIPVLWRRTQIFLANCSWNCARVARRQLHQTPVATSRRRFDAFACSGGA